jgi:hypothetical protein
MADVRILDDASAEIEALPVHERVAMRNAIAKLETLGDTLGYPHSSQIKGTQLRELRPRRGRSPWRAVYQGRGSQIFVVAAIGTEALHDPRGFKRAIAIAQARLDALEKDS